MRWPRAPHAGDLRRARQSEPLPDHTRGGGKEGLSSPLRDRGARSSDYTRGQRQPPDVRADGRRGDHRVPGGSDMARAMAQVARGSRRRGEQGLRHSRRRLERGRRPGLCRVRAGDAAAVVRASDGADRPGRRRLRQLGHHGGLVAGFLATTSPTSDLVGIGVSRDPADQEPLVIQEAQAVPTRSGSAGRRATVVTPTSAASGSRSTRAERADGGGGADAGADRGVLDPVYTGKAMAGLIGLARQGHFEPDEKVLFLHTGGLPSLHVYEDVVLGRTVLAD